VRTSALTALKAASTGPSPVAVARAPRRRSRSVMSAVCGPSVPQTTRRLQTGCGRSRRRSRSVDQRAEVVVEDLLLAVGQRLEPHEGVLELVVAEVVAELAQLGAEAWRPECLPITRLDVALRPTSSGRMISKVPACFSIPSWWMPLSWAKAFLPTMALLNWTGKPETVATRPRGLHDLGGVDAGLVGHDVGAHPHRHHHLLERGVARALAEAVDRALDLPRAGLDGGQRVGRRHAEVVVAVGRDHVRVDPRARVRAACGSGRHSRPARCSRPCRGC
jgi:hypothetical protein